MTKINAEEYRILKRLIEPLKKFKQYIARDEDGMLYAYRVKPIKYTNQKWVDGYQKVEVQNDLFQFIQWEDESPYNIQELIEEYLYDNQPKLFIDGQEQSFEFIEESEETEVKKDTEFEIWKDITGYEGIYQVSNFGRIKSLGRFLKRGESKIFVDEFIMSGGSTPIGYKTVNLTKNKVRKAFSVHRLVAEAFIPNPEGKPEVNHIDGDKLNNNYANLEWCTRRENLQHAYDTGLVNQQGSDSVNAKLSDDEVLEIRELYKTGRYTYDCLAEEYQVGASTIGRVVRKEVYQNV